MVNAVRAHPVEQCTVESMSQYFKPELQQQKLEARMTAAEDGETMVQLCNRLQHAALTEKLVPESEEEESRTVEFCDIVMHVPHSRRRSQRVKETKAKMAAVQPATTQESGTKEGPTTEAAQEAGAALQQGSDEPEGAPAQLAKDTDFEEVHVQAEEVARVLDTDTVVKCQMQQPMMKHIKEYIADQVLPASRLERIRMLEVAPMYEVNKAGMLCRVRQRGKQGSLGMDMQVVVPEELRGTVIAGCHVDKEGHASVLKTFQKVRERFYWPGMFMDVQRYLKFCPECGLNAQRRSKAPIMQLEANAPGETVVMDLLHYPQANGHKYVLVVVDAFSRWAEVAALIGRSIQPQWLTYW